MEIRYSKYAYKYLKKLHRPKAEQIINAIDKIPYEEGNIQKMKSMNNLYRLKVNDYRVLFSRDYDTIFIEKIGSRGDVYHGSK